MCSVNSTNPLETTVLGHSTPSELDRAAHTVTQIFAYRERNLVRINTMLHRKVKSSLITPSILYKGNRNVR